MLGHCRDGAPAAFAASFVAVNSQAQTVTPNTTLCAAQTKTQTSVCLTATTNVVNQTGVYVDQEYELVQLSSSQVVCTGPCYVPVSRNNRNAGSGPTAHANSSIAWLALTPSASLQPGVNGFSLGTNMTEIGTCTRTTYTYLPHIWVNRGIKRDCTTSGVWTDFAPGAGVDYPSPSPFTVLTAAAPALSVSSGRYALSHAGAATTATLAAPTSGVDDGMIIELWNTTAYASTLTATSLLQTGGGSSPYTTATFGSTTAFVGGHLILQAYGGFWYVVSSTGVAFT